MDVTNTVKVSHIRAAAAYKKALAAWDAMLPELKVIADASDAKRKAAYNAAIARWRKETFGEDEQRLAWAKYDQDYAEWDRPRMFSARPAAPVKPDFPRPPKHRGMRMLPMSREYRLDASNDWLNDTRTALKDKLAMASVALAPFRVDARTAVLIAECEDGSYIEQLKAAFKRLEKHTDNHYEGED